MTALHYVKVFAVSSILMLPLFLSSTPSSSSLLWNNLDVIKMFTSALISVLTNQEKQWKE